jgi:hypothetical protein
MYKYFLGIDPGQSGAISIINSEGVLIKVISFKNHIRVLWGFKIINARTIAEELRGLIKDFSEVTALIERVNSYNQGRNSAFNFGANAIGLVLILEVLGVGEINSTPPTEWKDLMGVSVKNLGTFINGKDKDKALKKLSEAKANKLFPYFKFNPSATADEEESALLAYLCWNSNKGK